MRSKIVKQYDGRFCRHCSVVDSEVGVRIEHARLFTIIILTNERHECGLGKIEYRHRAFQGDRHGT